MIARAQAHSNTVPDYRGRASVPASRGKKISRVSGTKTARGDARPPKAGGHLLTLCFYELHSICIAWLTAVPIMKTKMNAKRTLDCATRRLAERLDAFALDEAEFKGDLATFLKLAEGLCRLQKAGLELRLLEEELAETRRKNGRSAKPRLCGISPQALEEVERFLGADDPAKAPESKETAP